MLQYQVEMVREDEQGSEARCKRATLSVDTSKSGRVDRFNPAELLLSAVAACMMKNIERVAPILNFSFERVHISVQGWRQDKPPMMERIEYRVEVETDEPLHKLELLHRNIQQYGTIYNTVKAGTRLEGELVRM